MIKTAVRETRSRSQNLLEKTFWKHVDLGNQMPQQTADNKLIAYAYYKQGVLGDVNNQRPTENSSVIETFKHDSWKQLKGMSKDEARRLYIATIQRLRSEQQ